MNGVLVVDKPAGLTSFDVVARVRRLFGEKRVGHTGTLDPMATGVLVLCLGEATKLVQALTEDDKAYEAEAILGVETDSEDATGKVIAEVSAKDVTRARVEETLALMTGDVMQRPPMHSAVRIDGERLYERAHRGEVIDRPERPVRIDSLTLTDFEERPSSQTVRVAFTVRCGKGTYVRTIAAELGKRLGVGAHLSVLRRTRVGALEISRALPLTTLSGQEPLLGLVDAIERLPTVDVPAESVRAVRDGKLSVISELRSDMDGRVKLLAPGRRLLALAVANEGKIVLERVFNDVDIDPGFGPNTATKKAPKNNNETKDL